MTRVRFLSSIAGDRFSYAYGDVVDVESAEAERMIAGGIAEAAPNMQPTRQGRPVPTAPKAVKEPKAPRAPRANRSTK